MQNRNKSIDVIIRHLFPNLVVESKKSSSGLIKAVKDLENAKNRYVIVFDNSFDNTQAVMERKLLKQYADTRENVVLMDIICFEYILLEFKSLIDWIYAPDDEFLKKRTKVISAKLLFDLTRNTGFEVSKGRIGDCWIGSCCEWKDRMDNDICGLDHRGRLSVQAKMKSIYEGTCLKKQFNGM